MGCSGRPLCWLVSGQGPPPLRFVRCWSAQLVAPKTPNKFGTPQLVVRGAWRWVVAADCCVGLSTDRALRRYDLFAVGVGNLLRPKRRTSSALPSSLFEKLGDGL